eukprot:TRINITY_DN3466_c0_g1_i2.p1 TRINITY_DN3466_c0_g1~~TRINITY_DN3466_c0_g1_i2.p1  ORF type:complete len:851 (+),score=195.88 TRINITY_DN3466_c0_g1_i2:117-2669(+)
MASGSEHLSIQIQKMGSLDYDYVVCFAATIPADEVAWVVLVGSDLNKTENAKSITISSGGGGVSLKEAFKAFEEYVISKLGSSPDSICIVVNGEKLLWDDLRAECENQGFKMPKRLNRFFDIQSEFRRRYGQQQHQPALLHSLGSMLEHLGIHHGDLPESDHKLVESGGPALSEAMTIAQLFRRLIQDGHRLHTPITVPDNYKAGSEPHDFQHLHAQEARSDSPQPPPMETPHPAAAAPAAPASNQIAVIHMTGLSETFSPDDIVTLLAPVRILNGPAGVLRLPTTPTEAHVILASASDLELALSKSSSTIRIAASSYDDLQKTLYPPHQAYLQAAQSSVVAAPAAPGSPAAPATTSDVPPPQPVNDDRGIVKLRGLPWECRTQDIINFFSGLQLIPDGIHMLIGRDGRFHGDAYVEFQTKADAETASKHYHNRMMGRRYIEVFMSNPQELQRVLDNQAEQASGRRGPPTAPKYSAAPPPPSRAGDGFVVRMRGIPWSTKEYDVREFFEGLNIAAGGIYLTMDEMGRPGGEAFVEFADERSLDLAMRRDKSMLGNRYVELFRATRADISNMSDLGDHKRKDRRRDDDDDHRGGYRDRDRDYGRGGRGGRGRGGGRGGFRDDRDSRGGYDSRYDRERDRDDRGGRDYRGGGGGYGRDRYEDDYHRDRDRDYDRDYDRDRGGRSGGGGDRRDYYDDRDYRDRDRDRRDDHYRGAGGQSSDPYGSSSAASMAASNPYNLYGTAAANPAAAALNPYAATAGLTGTSGLSPAVLQALLANSGLSALTGLPGAAPAAPAAASLMPALGGWGTQPGGAAAATNPAIAATNPLLSLFQTQNQPQQQPPNSGYRSNPYS